MVPAVLLAVPWWHYRRNSNLRASHLLLFLAPCRTLSDPLTLCTKEGPVWELIVCTVCAQVPVYSPTAPTLLAERRFSFTYWGRNILKLLKFSSLGGAHLIPKSVLQSKTWLYQACAQPLSHLFKNYISFNTHKTMGFLLSLYTIVLYCIVARPRFLKIFSHGGKSNLFIFL